MDSIPYSDLIVKWAYLAGIDAAWLAGIIQAESGFQANIKTWEPKVQQYSYGLGQLLLTTAQTLGYTGDGQGLLDPETNILWTARYIRQLSDNFGGDLSKVYSAYNSGSSTAYLTSTEVAGNVARVLAAVESYAGAFASAVSGSVEATAAAAAGAPALDVGTLVVLAVIGFLLLRK